MSQTTTFDQLCAFTRETALLRSVEELLQWDERTYLPAAAGTFRADQITYLSSLVHRRRTDPRLGAWLEELSASSLAEDPHSDAGATIRHLWREYQKLVRVPPRLVEALARAAVLGQQTWAAARRGNDFRSFQPRLVEMVQLKREQAEAIGDPRFRYDALLDEFEPGATTQNIADVLAGLRQELVPLVAAITHSGRSPRSEIVRGPCSASAQEALGRELATRIGFDFRRGRLDVTDHPFCTTLGPDDCRILTRYDESLFTSSLFTILHEAGHGMYEQALRTDQFGLPPGTCVSLGIHESQSRLWENQVGRSYAFWQYLLPKARGFLRTLDDAALDDVYFAVNDVRPSLIRVEADEVTYNLHIVIRFELEQALIDGELLVDDLPGAWREKYEQSLGVVPPDETHGVLQDVHWAAGLFGYFPTYALGNLYAAQLFAAADQQVGPLHEQFRQGQFASLRDWLRQHIHRQGQCYTAQELIERISGERLSHAHLLNYLTGKYGPLYGLR